MVIVRVKKLTLFGTVVSRLFVVVFAVQKLSTNLCLYNWQQFPLVVRGLIPIRFAAWKKKKRIYSRCVTNYFKYIQCKLRCNWIRIQYSVSSSFLCINFYRNDHRRVSLHRILEKIENLRFLLVYRLSEALRSLFVSHKIVFRYKVN